MEKIRINPVTEGLYLQILFKDKIIADFFIKSMVSRSYDIIDSLNINSSVHWNYSTETFINKVIHELAMYLKEEASVSSAAFEKALEGMKIYLRIKETVPGFFSIPEMDAEDGYKVVCIPKKKAEVKV